MLPKCISIALAISCFIAPARGEVLGVWFSPNGGCQEAIVDHIDRAKETIHWQAYNLTSQPTADALKRAHSRGVTVTVICDWKAAQSGSSKARELASAGVNVFLDKRHPIAHDKTRIFDSKVILMGSFNDSKSAEKANGETLIAFDDREEVAACIRNFRTHLSHSERLR